MTGTTPLSELIPELLSSDPTGEPQLDLNKLPPEQRARFEDLKSRGDKKKELQVQMFITATAKGVLEAMYQHHGAPTGAQPHDNIKAWARMAVNQAYELAYALEMIKPVPPDDTPSDSTPSESPTPVPPPTDY